MTKYIQKIESTKRWLVNSYIQEYLYCNKSIINTIEDTLNELVIKKIKYRVINQVDSFRWNCQG